MIPEPTPREAIHDLLARYCRGIDRRDRALVIACFHPDGTDDHGTGPRSVPEFVEWCFGLLAGYDHTFHLLGQSVITFVDEHRATVETYGVAHHRRAGGPDHRNLVTGFRYLDDVSYRQGEWRIQHRRGITDWSRVDREDDWWEVPASHLRGRPGPDDPSASD